METAGAVVTGDVRILSVLYETTGERFRDFAAAVQILESIEWSDSPVRGPCTVLWVVRFMKQHGGTPSGWHQRWMVNCRLQTTDSGVALHEHFCKTLEIMVCFDQLAVGALASAEYCCRQIQMVEERWRERVAGATDDLTAEATLFSGAFSRGTICVCPALQAWIAEELKKESAVAKERRKAREERQLGRPPPKGGASKPS